MWFHRFACALALLFSTVGCSEEPAAAPHAGGEAMVEGMYQVWWTREGPSIGELTLGADGRYRFDGQTQPGERMFYFDRHRVGRYAIEMRTDATQTDALEADAVVCSVRFDPDREDFEPDDPRRSLLIRWDAERSLLVAHSLVSEVESWRMEKSE